MFKAMLGLYFVLIILHSCIGAEKALEELYAMQGDIKGITKSLVVDGLEDPYEVDISKLNRTNNFFQTKETKIIGGVEVPMHYFPFQASKAKYFRYFTFNS